MKAKEAPEKIYLDSYGSGFSHGFHTNTLHDNDIEYTRTDVFIEKAVQYLKNHKDVVETEDNGIIGWIPDYFIEDFKKYMKGG